MPVVVPTGDTEPDRQKFEGKTFSPSLQMLGLGVPVPPAFCITLDECQRFHDAGGEIAQEALEALQHLEEITERTFTQDLLVSVRSGRRPRRQA
jgi:pyruvate, orthophosphate dikinase